MTPADEPREDFRRACKSLDRIGAALQVLSILGGIIGIVAAIAGGDVPALFIVIPAAIVLYALGAIFDFLNRGGLYIIDVTDRPPRS